MSSKSREQKLVDIAFAVAIMAAERLHGYPKEQVAEWVAKQLHDCGFDTVPMGLSWGVLKDDGGAL